MHPSLRNSTFFQAVTVSELLTEEKLHEVVKTICEERGPDFKPTDIDDELLSSKLIELGWLNSWQVGQLKEGRTKFSLGPYKIVDSIGKGGMGHVFLGEHRMLGRREAIKVLPKSKTTPAAIENFQREIRAQAQLNHPNLVRVSYADRDGDTYFFVTEFVPGADLRQLVRRFGRLTMHEAATIISQAAEAIAYAHKQGLVHRDVKPGNLLVTPEGHTKVTDLGLAWFLVEDDVSFADQKNKVVGTVDYLAPEIIRTPGTIEPCSDIYALGCTLYYAVTGKVPFPGGKAADKLRRHLDESPINPRRFNPDLSDMFLDVLADMIEKDPKQRIRSASEIVKRLRPWTLSSVAVGQSNVPGELSPPTKVQSQNLPGLEETATNITPQQAQTQSQDNQDSQISQGTLRMSSWQEETLSLDDELSSELSVSQILYDAKELPKSLVIVVSVAVIAVLVVIIAILLQSR